MADATLYLDFFSLVTIGWQWLLQGVHAQRGLATATADTDRHFYEGKLITMRYFMEYELPKIAGLQARLHSSERVTMEARAHHFA